MMEPKKQHLPENEPQRSSSIERAMQAFDRGQFVPPAAPGDMLPPQLNPQLTQAPQAYQPAPQAYQPAPQAYQPEPQAYQPAPQAQPQPQAYAPQPQGYYQPTGAPPAYAAPQQAQPVYHRVNRQNLTDEGMILPEGGPTGQAEEFRIVKRQLLGQAEELRRRGTGGAAQRIMVTSPHAGEGKTFCAVNLAMSIAAEKEVEVVLVDLDIARSSALSTLGLPGGPGLMDALAEPRIDVRQLVMATDVPGLSVLPGGRPTNSDAEYLASSRATQVLDMLTEGHPNRIVLFDTPPALAATLPAEVAKLVGQVMLVVRADKTSSSAVSDAASLLAGCPNIQLLLNAVQFSPSGRRFGSYHGYRG